MGRISSTVCSPRLSGRSCRFIRRCRPRHPSRAPSPHRRHLVPAVCRHRPDGPRFPNSGGSCGTRPQQGEHRRFHVPTIARCPLVRLARSQAEGRQRSIKAGLGSTATAMDRQELRHHVCSTRRPLGGRGRSDRCDASAAQHPPECPPLLCAGGRTKSQAKACLRPLMHRLLRCTACTCS
jgi:hypothetical protein